MIYIGALRKQVEIMSTNLNLESVSLGACQGGLTANGNTLLGQLPRQNTLAGRLTILFIKM